ncbi:MAG: hypothetical protein GX910_00350 [Clostridiaceae bacterium]|nr:hypothetical protein [Clostridiaceae bacterium]
MNTSRRRQRQTPQRTTSLREKNSRKQPSSLQETRRRVPNVVWAILGVILGLLISAASGVYIIYADMMSRVTHFDPVDDAILSAPNLLLTEFPEILLANNMPDDPEVTVDPIETIDPSIEQTEAEQTLPEQGPVPSEWQNIPRSQGEVKVRTMNNVENILLFGVDSRGQNYRGRSDTIIVASINHNTRTITFVSFFRAIEVKIPGYSEPTLLNAAYAYGGPRLAIQTVEANFGIPITGFLTFNFASLQKLVDAVGGVKITMTAAEARALDASQGLNLVTGWGALQYARLRKIDTDFHRNQRQRNVIEAILNRVAEGNATTLYNAATVVLANSATNLNLNSYVMNAQTLLRYSRRQMQVPIWYGAGKESYRATNRYGQEVWPLYDKQKTADRIYNFLMN